MVWASRPAIPIFAARNAPEFALRDYGSLARSWGAGENFRQADFSVSIKKEEAAPEVKADSLYVRLVIAKHSLERVLETGLRMRLWRKTAATGACWRMASSRQTPTALCITGRKRWHLSRQESGKPVQRHPGVRRLNCSWSCNTSQVCIRRTIGL